MTRGEQVRVLDECDLFGLQIQNLEGIFLKTCPSSGKHLIHIPDNSEWVELYTEQIERLSPGYVPERNLEFVNRIKMLVYTTET